MTDEPVNLLDELDYADRCIHGRSFDDEAECAHCADLAQLRERLAGALEQAARATSLEADLRQTRTRLERADLYADQQFHRAAMLGAQLAIARADLDASLGGDRRG